MQRLSIILWCCAHWKGVLDDVLKRGVKNCDFYGIGVKFMIVIAWLLAPFGPRTNVVFVAVVLLITEFIIEHECLWQLGSNKAH